MTKMPITKARVKNHFQYGFWKYLLLIALCVFGWNMLYTVTRYQPPEHLKVEFYLDGFETDETIANMNGLLDTIHQEALPEMELVSYTVLTNDEVYGDMQLTVWTSAGQGDAFLLLKDRFRNLAGNGALVDLQPYIDQGLLLVDGLTLTAGRVRNQHSGETHQYGIPADSLPGLADCGGATTGAVLCVLVGNGNEENTVRFLGELIARTREPLAP